MNKTFKALLGLLFLLQPFSAFGEHVVRGVVRGVEILPDNLLIFTIEGGKPRCPRYREYFYTHKDAGQVKSVLSFLMTSKISNVPVTLLMEDDIKCAYHGMEGVSSITFGER